MENAHQKRQHMKINCTKRSWTTTKSFKFKFSSKRLQNVKLRWTVQWFWKKSTCLSLQQPNFLQEFYHCRDFVHIAIARQCPVLLPCLRLKQDRVSLLKNYKVGTISIPSCPSNPTPFVQILLQLSVINQVVFLRDAIASISLYIYWKGLDSKLKWPFWNVA